MDTSDLKAKTTSQLETMLSDPSITDYDLLVLIADELVNRQNRLAIDANRSDEFGADNRPLAWI